MFTKKITLLLFLVTFLLISITLTIFFRPKLENKITETRNHYDRIIETLAPQPTQLMPDGLPDKHLINTAFIPQAPDKIWDQPWQDSCEEAALLTVDYYYRNITPDKELIKLDIKNMIDYENTINLPKDVNITQMASISATLLKYQPLIIDNPDIQIIKKYLIQDIPIIIPANGKTLFKENKRFRNGGPWYHNIVILGYDDNKNQFTVHDVGTQYGANYRYSYSLILDSIHDFPPDGNKENIENGSKKILILLK